MYKIAGHTMGTPEYTVCEAIELFRKIGADGAEIIVQDGYKSGIPTDCSKDYLDKIKKCAEDNHIQIIALTPYNSYFNVLDEKLRMTEVKAIEKVIEYAEYLGAKFIRIYGGNISENEKERLDEKFNQLVKSMKYLGDKAAEKKITLVVENHFNTMTVSAKDSVKLMEAVNNPWVGILYDQANLTFTGNENYEEAISIQQQYVRYMHVKDLEFIKGKSFVSTEVSHPKEEERNVVTKIVGEGAVPWSAILKKVKEWGYDGWLSMEYERRWHPMDIPNAATGMKKGIEFVRSADV